jgi:DNA mismatch repair protein MutL
MGRIHVLPDQVANKIAAGEVVERPVSVVKELLENSLDAGAGEFRIDVENGGRRLIRVADDGSGMLRDDAMLAFERHATSKLTEAKDLAKIATLGFRGEALPSIASVSRLVLETRTAQEETGMRVEIAGGRVLKVDEVALAAGTTVTVRDLFYNVPARKKFLRSEQTELAHIAALVTHYSLAHPEKTFTLRNGVNELLSAPPVGDLRDRVYQVFGSRVVNELVELPSSESELRPASAPDSDDEDSSVRRYRLRGYVSRPQYQKLNRNSIFLFVNNRLIRDRLLMHAVTSAYHNLMPAACYPFALLFLSCDFGEVDVNVHPSKTEVRFRSGSFVHDMVRDAIRNILMESRPVSALPAPAQVVMDRGEQPAAGLPFSEFSQRLEGAAWADVPSVVLPGTHQQPAPADMPEVVLPSPRALVPEHAAAVRIPETHQGFPMELGTEPASLEALADLRPLGQIHESFIIAAGRDGLWIIDQHVAHERVLFEKVLKDATGRRVESQRLLLPVVVELTAAQQIEYARIAGELEAAGLETEPFGRLTVAVKSAPAGIAAGDIEKLLSEILDVSESELRRVSLDELRRGIAASIACRAAIKVNTPLTLAKMEWLLGELARTDCPMTCPHGRPIALRYSTRDILRGFHRI